ncbi:MAG: ABC transporter permease [Chryseotalea sp.]|jgi:putative ABC transport system permease protein
MIKNYLLITLRHLAKNKIFITINVLGLAISIACCVVAYFNYDFNAAFDSHHKNANTIYRVNSIREFQNNQTKFGFTPVGLGNVVRQNVADVDAVVRYNPSWVTNLRKGDDVFFASLVFVDTPYFDLFSYEFLYGNGELKDKKQIFISDELAKKLFDTEEALGKTVTQQLDSGKVKEYFVSGVFKKQPSNSSFSHDAIAHTDNFFELNKEIDENSWRFRSTLFVQVKNPQRIPEIEKQLLAYTENNNKIREDFIIKKFELEIFEGMATRDSYNEVNGTWTRSASPLAAVVGIAVMAILVLLIACFNLTNTSIAISSRRLKEIGVRKVMGSTRTHLIFQFIGETMLICLLALVVGVLLGEFVLIPAFNALWPDLKIVTDYFGRPNFLYFMVGTLLFTGLLAGSYPAFYISKFQPTSILKGKLKFGGTNGFTRVLLTLQFAISLIGIVCSLAFYDNANYQKSIDIGMDQKGVAFTYVNNRSEYETFKNELAQNPDVLSICGSPNHFYSSSFNDPIKADEKEIEVDILDIGDDYIKTVGLKILQGRDFVNDSETDRKESVIITENLAEKFGWDKPLGKEIIWADTNKYYVIGVVKNIYNNGLWDEMDPVMLRYAKKDQVSHILAGTTPDKALDLKKEMENIYKKLFPDRVANVRFNDENMIEANTVNNNIVKMFVFLGLVALILSTTGLFTLVSLNIIKKMKEIGVRKVLGASSANITKVINKEFVIILSIASLLGCLLGSYMAEMLMQSIWDYYLKATVYTLVIAVVVMLLASVISIAYKILKTTRLNPAHVLRDE